MLAKDLLALGKILAPHGVQGFCKLLSFTDPPENIFTYAPLFLADGRGVWVEKMGITRHKTHEVWLARIYPHSPAKPLPEKLVPVKSPPFDRQQMDGLIGLELFLPRASLPPPDDADDFYHADLIGCLAVAVTGEPMGKVTALHDYGAGTFLVVTAADGSEAFVPFTRAAVPDIDLAARRVTVDGGDE